MKRAWIALVIGVGASAGALAAAPTPYDFTGHWTGTATQAGQSFPLFADFTGTQTFTGTFAVETDQLLTCTVQGQQKKKVKITLGCADGSHVKIKGRLEAGTITGRYHSSRKGHRSRSGAFMLSTPGPCVPTGQDCTDPATGGGEAAVCCNGDCHKIVNADSTESHACN